MILARRILWGVRSGVVFGLAFSALALVIRLLGGEGPFEVHHTSFAKMIASYLLGGISAGVIVGALRPLTKSKPGAAVVGFFAAIPIGMLVRLAMLGNEPWEPRDTIVTLLVCIALGAPVGVMYRDIFRDKLADHKP